MRGHCCLNVIGAGPGHMQLSRTQSTLAHANSAWGLARKVKCISYLLVKLRCLRVTCARH